MGANRRFFALGQENSVFKFTIDTRNIVSGATDGSENPLSFRLPFFYSQSGSPYNTNCIVKVNDGRPDLSLTTLSDLSNLSKVILTFTTAGIYQITVIGKIGGMQCSNNTIGIDRLKMISIDLWGSQVFLVTACFRFCTNLEFLATNTLILPAQCTAMFAGTKGFPNKDLSNIVVSNVVVAVNWLDGVPTKFKRLFNPFFDSLVNGAGMYSNIDFSEVEEVNIVSNTTTLLSPLFNANPRLPFYGVIKLSTPNNTNIGALCYRFSNAPPPLDQVDIRSVTSALNFLLNPMSKANTDKTLLGWANNYDWTGIAPITNKVTLDFKASTHSNISTVNNAKAFLVAKGYVFTNLTAV